MSTVKSAPTMTERGHLPVRREIDLDAIRHNVRALASISSPAALMVVVKADAYSHGAVAVATAALEAGASRLGVATINEALELRQGGIDAPVLAWLATPGAPYASAIIEHVDLAAYSLAQLEEIAAAAQGLGRAAAVHLKAETGMWRGGAADEWLPLVERAADLERHGLIEVVGVWSHLACADEPDHPANDAQREAFEAALATAAQAGLRPRWRHLANSAAALTRPDLRYDLVRCGLATYGVNPLAHQATPADLRPAMRILATIAHVKSAPAGVGVSYGHTHRTKRPTRLAIVPLGYADGVPMVPPGSAPVGLDGASLTVAGRVCMDQLVLDVGDTDVSPGDEVVLLGPGDHGEHTVEEWAAVSGRSPYEILTGTARRRLPPVWLH